MSTAALVPLPTPPAPEYRSLAAPAIRDAGRPLAVALFVGRPDPALNAAPVDLPAVNGR